MISPMFQKHLIAREVAAVDLKCMHQTIIIIIIISKLRFLF